MLATEASKPIKLEDEQWTDWIGIMRELLSSSETLISSDSLKILTAIFQQFPEKMEQEYMSAKELQEHKLGRLTSTKCRMIRATSSTSSSLSCTII